MPADQTHSGEQTEIERLRARVEELEREAGTPADEPRTTRRLRWRRITTVVLLVVGTVSLLVANVTVFLKRTLLDTESFVNTLEPLAEREEIIDAVSAEIAVAIVEAIDARALVEDALPEETKVLAGPIASGVEGFIGQTTREVIGSDAFASIWEEALRLVHEAAAEIIGGGSGLVRTASGEVQLDLSKVVETVTGRLSDAGLDVDLDPDLGVITLYSSDQLAQLQDGVDLLDRLAVVMWVLTVAALVGAVVVSVRRRRTVLVLGVAIAAVALVTLAGLDFLRSEIVDRISEDQPRAAVAAAYDTVLRGFKTQSNLLVVLGLLLTGGAWLVGPSRWAIRIRTFTQDQLRGRGAAFAPSSGVLGTIRRTLAEHRGAFHAGAVIVGLVVLVLWERPTVLVLLIVALLVLGAVAAIEVFADRRPAPES